MKDNEMDSDNGSRGPSGALSLLASERPRNVSWLGAAGLLFGDWGTSRLYVLGLAFLVAGRSSFYLMLAMSVLLLAVGWAYTQICRLYPDGGGVYTAGKHKARIVGVVGALLLFADYTVTASLSSLEAFHYFGLSTVSHEAHVDVTAPEDAGDYIAIPHHEETAESEALWDIRSPGLWAIVAIAGIGAFNLLGPKHSAKWAVFAAIGMVVMTIFITAVSIPRIDWGEIRWGTFNHDPWDAWRGFVFIVLALSGVEAISNLTGVMRKPVALTARKAIWIVTLEVATINLLLAIVMVSLSPGRAEHTEDMLAYIAREALGGFGEWPVRIVGGLLLLSATNTAVNGLMSICYVMSRDGELPGILQKLNSFGSPWVAAIVATTVPICVLLFAHDLATLASLYAIGVVGAVAMNCILGGIHPRLRRWWRKGFILALGALMVVIWVTLALTKIPATIFVTIIMVSGLSLRAFTRYLASRKPKLSLFRQAIVDQLTPEALAKPKLLLATAGSTALAEAAMQHAKAQDATLVISFVREVSLDFRAGVDERMNIDTDPAAQAMIVEFLEQGARHGVPIIPTYDTGPDAAVLIAEAAAMNAAQEVLIGSSRRGRLHQIIRGSFQRKLEALLPPDIPVHVLDPVHSQPARG